ncbi:MAG: TonB-dependent receptor [Xanthomonadaceae bacterium]|nr:TonB-dependent receptor [Xanthomonadaceae bacterium]
MKCKNYIDVRKSRPVRRTAMTVAITAALAMTGGQAIAQSTTGTIFGQAPVVSGETVQITGGAGYNRIVPVDSSGRYSVTVPVGTYQVNLLQNGKVIQSKSNITPNVSSGTAVNFAAAGGKANPLTLSTITVTASGLPAVDVSSTRQSLIITAQQLSHLPLGRSGESIALLAPGTVYGAGALGTGPTGAPLVSFGGSSIAENAYYINGYNTSDPLYNEGGITLPYGSIEQQQTITSGYGAAYGRSAGGVISQIGKSGTNEWHFGGQALWRPDFAQGSFVNYHYNNPLSSATGNVGKLYEYRQPDSNWETVYDAYVGGPLIKDKLFFFMSAEADKQYQVTNGSVGSANIRQEQTNLPKLYAKLDWNINDNNVLSLTGIRTSQQYHGAFYNYDNTTHTTGAFSTFAPQGKNSFGIWIAKYTSYITDNLTLNALYGKMSGTYYTAPPGSGASSLAHITNANQENPALDSGNANGIQNANQFATLPNSNHTGGNNNLRIDLDWKLGSHDLQFGIDNQNTFDRGDGSITTGPGYAWQYGNGIPTNYIVGSNPANAPWVDAPAAYPNGAGGYYVSQVRFFTAAAVAVRQRAQFIQDNWQATDNLLLKLGLRNDQFTNLNAKSVPYIREHSGQLAPRLGFSWDVFGDSSLKVFGNAGRYYLALPTGVAVREASASTFTSQYYTYSGIDPTTGYPTGLTPINSNGQTSGPGVPVSLNNEYGQALNPYTVHSTNIKAEYQDQFVLGMQQQFAKSWVYGVQGTYSRLGRIIDDVGDPIPQCEQLIAQNPSISAANPGALAACEGNPASYNIQGSVLINPGSTNNFSVVNPAGGYYHYTVSPSQFGFPKASRKYYALEAFLEHVWDGKWTGKLDYVFSKSYGSTEGPVQSNIGQGGSSGSITTQWDYGQLMQYANGVQANSRKHVFKAFGSYQIAPEWLVSGIVTVASGTPKSCLGYFGPGQTNPGLGYGSFTHWCNGKPAPGGSTGYTPWIHQLDLSLEYRPLWAQKKLAIQLQVHNVLNEQKVTQYYPYFGQYLPGATPATTVYSYPSYGRPEYTETPRYVQLGVTYDW